MYANTIVYYKKCYNYDITPTICNEEKRIINIAEPKIEPLTQLNEPDEYLSNIQQFIGL